MDKTNFSKITFFLVTIFMMYSASLHADNDTAIQLNQLPVAASKFINQHFADHKVASAKMESELLSKSYEVTFTDGDQIEFDGKGNWKEVECKRSAVPATIIPAKIANYIAENYPDNSVIKIEKNRRNYEIELKNGVELKFDSKFNVIDVEY